MKNSTAKILSIGSAIISILAIATPQIHAGSCTASPAGLVGWWPGESNANDVASGNNGTLENGASFTAGEMGQAFVFAGSGEAVQLGNPAVLQLQNFTIETWIQRGSVSNSTSDPQLTTGIFMAYGYGGYGFGIYDDGSLFLTRVGIDAVTIPNLITNTNWHHVALTKAGTNVVFYVDGVSYPAPSPYTSVFNFDTDVAIGGRGDNLAGSFLGSIDEMSIYNRALSSNEIAAIFNAGSAGKCPGNCTPPPSGIISWWSAEGNGDDNVGTNTASVPVGVTYAPGEVGQGFNFDGGANRIIVADAPELNFGANQDFSIEAWIQPDAATTDYGVMSIVEKRIASGGSDSPNGYEFCLVNGEVACRFQSVTFESTGPDLRDGFFHHVALTVSRNSTTGGKLYADGVVVLTFDPTALNGSLINSEPLRIGNHPALDLNCFFKGIVDEVSIYNRALSTNEIRAIYNTGSEGKCMSPCTPPPSNIISWWPAEGNANDIVGGNNGITTNITYAIGEVGNAFNFNGSNAYVRVPANSNLNVGTGNGFTFETWINPAMLNPQPLAEWNSNSGDSGIGTHFWISEGKFFPGPAGCLYANVVDTSGGDHYFSTGGGVVVTNAYQHIALTYDQISGTAVIYWNGTAVQTSNLGTFIPQTSFDFYLGGRPAGFGAGSTYGGAMDEATLYNRVLAAAEIQAIYNAGSAGKCNSHPYIPPPRTATAMAEWAGAFVVGVDIVDGGAGYTNTPNVRFIGGGGTGAQASVVVSNGVVVAIEITNPGSGYTNTPVVVIDPPFIAHPILGIASISVLNFSHLNIGTNYQLQQLQSSNWINQSASFNASNTIYTQLVAGVPEGGDYRLAVTPVPAQAVAVPQVINGFVVAVRIITGGSGYATPPAVIFIGNGNVGSNATAVAGINKSGVVTNITVINAGMGYVNPVTIQIDPPPVIALFPTVLSGVVINSSGLAPYDNYQVQFKADMGAAWGDLSGGLFIPSVATNSQYIFLTSNSGYFRLQYVP